MLYLLSILICLSSDILLMAASSLLKLKEISLNKASIIFISIILTISSSIFIYLGKLSSTYLFKNYCNIFGGVLLLFIGTYYLIEYKKNLEYNDGFDISFYYDTFPKFRKLINSPSLIDKNCSKCIEINESLYISLPLSIYNSLTFFAVALTPISIAFTILFLFISTLIFLSVASYVKHITSKYLINVFAIIGMILIITGLLEIFL